MAGLKIEQLIFRILGPLAILALIFIVKLSADDEEEKNDTPTLPQSSDDVNPPINPSLEGCADLQGDYKLSPHGFKWLSVRQPSCDEIIFNHYDTGRARAFKFGKWHKYKQGKWTLNRSFRWKSEKKRILLEEFRNNHDEKYDCFGIQKYYKKGEELIVDSDITCAGETGTGDRYRKMVWVPKTRCLYPQYCDAGMEEEREDEKAVNKY
ncbi:MAG: hypothetical protein Kow0090_12520 [Myxococcota bacterium]